MKNRIYFLDNLRTFLIFLVVLYHSALVYQIGLESNWIVSDPVKSESMGLIGMYLDVFVMFILFFISGYFMPLSLNNKNDWGFIKSKAKRILLPWLIAVFTLIPLYKIIFLYSRGLPQEEWFSYFHFFERAGADLNFFANNPLQHWLWYLPVLFLFQIIYLGLSKTKLLSINISMKTAVISIFVVALIYSSVVSLYGLKGWYHSSILHFQRERLLVYFMIFLLGSLSYKLRIFDSESRNKKLYIFSNVMLTLGLTFYTIIALNLFFNLVYPDRNYYFISTTIDRIAYYAFMLISMFSFLHIIIDAFRFKLNKSNALMSMVNKSSYYVYIIHMVLIGGIALILLDLAIPTFIKFIMLTLLSFTISNLIVLAYYKYVKQYLILKIAILIASGISLFIIISS